MGGNESKAAVTNRNLYINESVYNIVNETVNSTEVQVEVKSTASNRNEVAGLNFSGNTGVDADITITDEQRARVQQCVEMKTIIDSVMSQLTSTDDKFDALLGMQNGLEQSGSETAAQVASKESTTVEGDNKIVNRKDFNVTNCTKIMATYKFLMYALAENESIMGMMNITNNKDSRIRFTKGSKMDAEVNASIVSEAITKAMSDNGLDAKSVQKAQEESTAAAKRASTATEITGDVADTIKTISNDVTGMVGGALKGWFSQNKTIVIVIGVIIAVIFLGILGIIGIKAVTKSKNLATQQQYNNQMQMAQMKQMEKWTPDQQMAYYSQRHEQDLASQQQMYDYRNQRRTQYLNQFNGMMGQPMDMPSQQDSQYINPQVPYQQMESQIYYGGGKTEFETDEEIEALFEPIKLTEDHQIVGVKSKKVVGDYDLYDKYGNRVKFNYEIKKFFNIDDIEIIPPKEQQPEEQLLEGAGINPGTIKNLISKGTKVVKKGAKYAKKGIKFLTDHKDQIKKGYKTAKKYGKKGVEFVDKHKGEIKEAGKTVHDVYREFRPKQQQVPVQQPQQERISEFDVPI